MTEKQLHKAICKYLKVAYPKVLFNTDMSGLKLTIGQATQAKKLRSCNGYPDLVIYENCNNYHALFLEVKKETPYKKDGTLKSNKHLEEQHGMHIRLKDKGYYARFVWDFDKAKEIIDDYLTKKLKP